MVLRKFHNLNNQETPQRFYTISADYRYLTLDNSLFKLFFEDDDNGNNQSQFMRSEISSRWDLLEHAFENIYNVESLDVDQYLEHVIRKERRTNLTKLVYLLEGYQRGRCFYCNEPLHDEQIAVDHVIPYQALMHNQFWNLVLANTFCNENKSDNIVPLHYVENLIARNEFFISSAHPLKDTLIRELGLTQQQRRQKVMNEYSYAKGKIVRIWGGSDKYDPSKDPFYRSWVNFLG
jgi:CRISPR/Cas system Type II protein with McrA/HNH and RuvC-like nuclease domain